VQSWPTRPEPSAGEDPTGRVSDLTRLCRAVTAHAVALGRPLPHRPWQPPLPLLVGASDLEGLLDPAAPGERRRRSQLAIGLIDRPDIQSRELLDVDLAEGGTVLAIGGPRSGRTTLLRSVLSEAVHRFGRDELHVHVIESAGSALVTDAASLPHAGTTLRGE
jgi:DNA segregation ATPase FtsK/SpoIIIE, S-DNA-T family